MGSDPRWAVLPSFRCNFIGSSSRRMGAAMMLTKGGSAEAAVLPISDIVKRKRIRLPESDDGHRRTDLIRSLFSVLCPPISNQSWVWSLTAQIPGCV